MILSIKNISKYYKDKCLFEDISFDVKKQQKIAIVGNNGTGKTTLLNILLGLDFPDNKNHEKYTVKIYPNVKIGYIKQLENFHENIKVLDFVCQKSKVYDYEAKTVLNKLGLEDYDKTIDKLSGGEAKKLSLAIALLEQTDLLILDEPTNHLDFKALSWLEEYLKKYKGAIILVSHDRYFLQKVTSDIFEIENSKLEKYKNVDFDEYLDLKAIKIAEETNERQKNKTVYKKELAWISRGVKARRTKSKDRIQRFEDLKANMSNKTPSSLDLTSISSRLGNKTIEINNLNFYYGEKQRIKDFNYNFQKYQRVGILGLNGSGKSTLLEIISGKIKVDNKSLIVGETVKIAYFSQTLKDINEDSKIIDFIKDKASIIKTVYGELSAEVLLERFLFSRRIIHQKISTLSGGEKKRLNLLYILMDNPNVLILDEPTNDLDVNTLLVLEEYIENFQGIVIVVSHDRYFLNKVIDDLLVFNSDKTITTFKGNYDLYIKEYLKKSKEPQKDNVDKTEQRILVKKEKFTYLEKQEFATIDQDIENLEKTIEEVDSLIKESVEDFKKLEEHLVTRKKLEEELELKNNRWMYLYEKEERINKGGM